VGEFLKARYNAGLPLNIYFWRDKTGHEIDCILQKKGVDVPIEIKSGRTIASDWFKNIQSWKHDTAEKTRPVLVYGGDEDQKRSDFLVTNWRRAGFLNT
jgi:predicted AAA+ superfamily ATPase